MQTNSTLSIREKKYVLYITFPHILLVTHIHTHTGRWTLSQLTHLHSCHTWIQCHHAMGFNLDSKLLSCMGTDTDSFTYLIIYVLRYCDGSSYVSTWLCHSAQILLQILLLLCPWPSNRDSDSLKSLASNAERQQWHSKEHKLPKISITSFFTWVIYLY